MSENSTDIMDWSGDGMSADAAKDTKGTLRRIAQSLRPQRFKLLFAALFATAAVALNVWAPWIFADAINVIFDGIAPALMGLGEANIDMARLGDYVLYLTAIYLTVALFTYFQELTMASVAQTLTLGLRKEVGKKLALVPLRFYDARKKGEILSRVTNDIERMNEIMQYALMRLFTSVLTIIGAIIFMFRINWILTLVAIGSILVGIAATAIISSVSGKLFAARQRALGDFNTRIEEYFTGQLEVKTYTMEDEACEDANKSATQLYKDDKKAQFIMFVIMPVIRFFNQVGYVGVAAIGANFVIQGRISIGQIVSFFQYVQMSAEPLTEGGYVVNSMQSAIASAERVFELIDEEVESPDPQNPLQIDAPKGDIVFSNVSFGYRDVYAGDDDNDSDDDAAETNELPSEPLMRDINLSAKAGQKVAIVGPTGAGKTTLVNLLMRFYEIDSGTITVDGVDIRDMQRHYLRSLFGMVLQDSWLFEGSVAENISYGRPEATREEVIEAAKMARADHFIRTLPQGYDTELDDESTSLSQGEKQLLCIARVILANPTILLLDEATSSVDTRTEQLIQDAMDNLMEGRTSFVIAHRLSTIRNADIILVMDEGDIVEVGNHDQLIASGGMYADIFNSQFD